MLLCWLKCALEKKFAWKRSRVDLLLLWLLAMATPDVNTIFRALELLTNQVSSLAAQGGRGGDQGWVSGDTKESKGVCCEVAEPKWWQEMPRWRD